jgi:hypothetical protein
VVNASLNWASIVGIVLAVGGAFLYFLRNFKPALARDYDVFFAAVGLLCGGILFFQGWRLDPILQFGQFLLAGTTVFFAYESVRLRGVTTEQARRSAYFDEEEPMPDAPPYRPRVGGRSWEEAGPDRFDEPQPLRRRIPSRGPEEDEEDFYRPRRTSRAAIPERAASRRPAEDRGSAPTGWDSGEREAAGSARRYSAGRAAATPEFGARRRDRDSQPEVRRGSRPVAASEAMPRSSRRGTAPAGGTVTAGGSAATPAPGVPQGSPIRSRSTDTAGAGEISDADYSPVSRVSRERGPSSPGATGGARDNSSRFDD